jgi:hypothetical protein
MSICGRQAQELKITLSASKLAMLLTVGGAGCEVSLHGP